MSSSSSDAEGSACLVQRRVTRANAAAGMRAKSLESSSSRRGKNGKRRLAAADKRLPPRDQPKQRTRTSEVRRDEIELLRKESRYLEAKVEFLQHRAGVFDQQCLSQQVLDIALLREFLRNQNLSMAGLKSAIATDTSDHFPSPLSTSIRLSADLVARRALLLAIKPQKIHDARQFLQKRTQFLDMTKRFSDTNQFETADGDICSSKLDVIPLYNATSVKQVYDALRYYVQNVEISTAEINGDIALREEADPGDDSVWLNRLVFLKKEFGVDVENSNAIFCEYTPLGVAGAERSDEGVIAIDFVDEDELYPYRPSERIRDNVTAVALIKSYPLRACGDLEQVDQPPDVGAEETNTNQEEVVVVSRWVQATFDRGEHNISDDSLFELRKVSDRVSDAALSLVRARFGSSAPS